MTGPLNARPPQCSAYSMLCYAYGLLGLLQLYWYWRWNTTIVRHKESTSDARTKAYEDVCFHNYCYSVMNYSQKISAHYSLNVPFWTYRYCEATKILYAAKFERSLRATKFPKLYDPGCLLKIWLIWDDYWIELNWKKLGATPREDWDGPLRGRPAPL